MGEYLVGADRAADDGGFAGAAKAVRSTSWPPIRSSRPIAQARLIWWFEQSNYQPATRAISGGSCVGEELVAYTPIVFGHVSVIV